MLLLGTWIGPFYLTHSTNAPPLFKKQKQKQKTFPVFLSMVAQTKKLHLAWNWYLLFSTGSIILKSLGSRKKGEEVLILYSNCNMVFSKYALKFYWINNFLEMCQLEETHLDDLDSDQVLLKILIFYNLSPLLLLYVEFSVWKYVLG